MTIGQELASPGVSADEAKTARHLPRRRRNAVTPNGIATILALLVLVTVILWTFVPSWFTIHDPLIGDPTQRFLAPSLEHWFGTDRSGRDTFTRVVHGTRNTVYGAVIGTTIGLVVGTVLGVAAGVLRGVVDAVLMRLVDVLLALPGFLLALCIVAAFGPGTTHVAVGVGIAAVAPFARVARGEALRVVQLEYVDAARISGARRSAVLFRHVLPNSAGPIVALIPTELGATILNIAGLGFLGYGAPPPTPEWGTLLSEGRDYLANAWWLTTLPGIVVLVAVLAVARAGHLIARRFRI